MRRGALFLTLFVAACDAALTGGAPPPYAAGSPDAAAAAPGPVRDFTRVVRAIEPVAERECRRRATDTNCDFLIRIDMRRNAPPNAYQSIDEAGRPVITFTAALIAAAANADELAFIMSHEAAHHIAGHLERKRRNAAAGAAIFAGLATLTGGGSGDVASAERLGAAVGARSYSKEFELEADALGTVIAYRAGFNPLTGARFFARIPDPGDRFLGSHPPNAERIETVRRVSAELGLNGS